MNTRPASKLIVDFPTAGGPKINKAWRHWFCTEDKGAGITTLPPLEKDLGAANRSTHNINV